jgi:hypothetical protein
MSALPKPIRVSLSMTSDQPDGTWGAHTWFKSKLPEVAAKAREVGAKT